MSNRIIQFGGMTIGAIKRKADRVEILVGHAIIIKNMDDAQSDTRWHGNVGIVLHIHGHQPPLEFFGESKSFSLSGHEKYIEHIAANH